MAYTLDFSINLGTAGAGLTDLRAQLVNTSGADVGSAVSSGFVEIGTASGFYLWHYTAIPAGHRGGVKFYSNAAASTILAFISINPEEGEYIIDPATLVDNVWVAADRTLTIPAVSGNDPVDGGVVNITIGATFDGTISGLSISASWTKIYFSVKCDKNEDDNVAEIQIVVSNPSSGSDGLKYLAGAVAATAANGSLTVNQGAGTIRIVIADDATASLDEHSGIYYDVKQFVSSASSIIAADACNIALAVTHSIS